MITAEILKDSISPSGVRLTTFEIEFPRFVLPEFNTHRAFSRNAASSRAIPIEAMIKQVMDNPAMPVWWGKNQSGMQAKEELSDDNVFIRNWGQVLPEPDEIGCLVDTWTHAMGDLSFCKTLWLAARDSAVAYAKQLSQAGLHKQLTNRILEPWAYTKMVVTSTNWDNWYNLRDHVDAQPEIRTLANIMLTKHNASIPTRLEYGEWHLPYINSKSSANGLTQYYAGHDDEESPECMDLEAAKKVSVSLCAQVSYRKSDDSVDKALKIYERLITSRPTHASPTEHQATPLQDPEKKSGNFTGWLQHRQLIKDNVCHNYQPYIKA